MRGARAADERTAHAAAGGADSDEQSKQICFQPACSPEFMGSGSGLANAVNTILCEAQTEIQIPSRVIENRFFQDTTTNNVFISIFR